MGSDKALCADTVCCMSCREPAWKCSTAASMSIWRRLRNGYAPRGPMHQILMSECYAEMPRASNMQMEICAQYTSSALASSNSPMFSDKQFFNSYSYGLIICARKRTQIVQSYCISRPGCRLSGIKVHTCPILGDLSTTAACGSSFVGPTW